MDHQDLIRVSISVYLTVTHGFTDSPPYDMLNLKWPAGKLCGTRGRQEQWNGGWKGRVPGK